ncbi:MAG: T9SS type A sorting domain-containing protein [Candidatus Kapabacteria bacterium]|nr:T9SS type A sorting domain-containing protein [Candidatus Kapabacteria bacterium]
MRIALLIACLVVACGSLFAQRDTSNPDRLIFGTFSRATSASVFVNEIVADGTTREQEISYTMETKINGCSIDSVLAGTVTTIVCSPIKIYPPRAMNILFDGCAPMITIIGSVTAIDTTTLTVELAETSVAGGVGERVGVDCDAQTVFASCDGRPLGRDDIGVGAEVAIRAAASKSLLARTVQTRDDCAQTVGVVAQFVSFDGTLFSVVAEPERDTVVLTVDPSASGVPADSGLALYTCDGRLVGAEQLQEGDGLSLNYLKIPRRGNFFLYAQLTKDCPTYITGRITRIDGSSVTVTTRDSLYSATLTPATTYSSCAERIATRDDLMIGQRVSATLVNVQGGFEVTTISVVDDCPFAFFLYGEVRSIDASTVVVSGISSEDGQSADYQVSLDDQTMLVDCSNEPLSRGAFSIGNIVSVHYRTRADQRIADVVIRQDPCDVSTIRGVIGEVMSSTIEVAEDNGATQVIGYDASTPFSDCYGNPIRIDTAYRGMGITCLMRKSSNGSLYLQAARIDVGCAGDSVSSGLVMSVGSVESLNGSTLTIATRDGSKAFALTNRTRMQTNSNAPAQKESMNAGDMVSVMSMTSTETGMPIAASVVVMESTTSVYDDAAARSLAISPNPAATVVDVVGPVNTVIVSIYNSRGEQVVHSSALRIDASSLPVGAYVVVVTGDGDVRSALLRIVR